MVQEPFIPVRESSLRAQESTLSATSVAVGAPRNDESRPGHAIKDVCLQPASADTPLDAERRRLIDDIAQQSHAQGPPPSLTDAGRATFERAGFEDRIGKRSDIEVRTRWLPPVIQEHVRPVVHTILRTEVTRDIHQHHIHPKIQPISDPDPIVLPTRHRFFSSIDGHWHEVIGDEAAIAILGEDVFLHGPKIMRTDRRPAAESSARKGVFESRVIEREHERDIDSDWKVVQGATTTDEAIVKGGELRDGLDGVTEGVRTMHVVL